MAEPGVDILFPPRVIPSLRQMRGPAWQDLINHIVSLEPMDIERLGFMLMMVHLCGCMTCQADSFKAMRGCHQCSILSIKRFRGDDRELSKKYSESINEIKKLLREETNG